MNSSLRPALAIGMVLVFMITALHAEPPECIEPQAKTGSSQAVVVDNVSLVHTTQHFAPYATISSSAQFLQILWQLDDTLKLVDSDLQQIVKLNIYVRDSSVTAAVEEQLAATFSGDHKPAVSFVVTPLWFEDAVVSVDAVAVTSQRDLQHAVRLPATEEGKGASRAAVLPAGPRVYISGQAEKGDGTLADATRQTMASLFTTLKWLELSPADVVAIKAFLTPMKDSSIAMKEIVKSFGNEAAPPISFVEWDSSLPIEIELVAAARPRENGPTVEYLTPPGMTASPVFARVARVSAPKTIYFSGLYGSTTDPNSEAEVRELFATTERLAAAAGSDLHHLVKATYYVTNNDVSSWHNQLRPMFYDPQRPPAASKAMVNGTGRERRTITWDMIAVPKAR